MGTNGVATPSGRVELRSRAVVVRRGQLRSNQGYFTYLTARCRSVKSSNDPSSEPSFPALGSLLRGHEVAPETVSHKNVSHNLSDGTVGGYDDNKVELTL